MQSDVLAIISVYRNSQQKLIKLIAEKQARGNVTVYQRSLLRQVNAELQYLDKQAQQWVNATIPKYYYSGVNYTNTTLRNMGVSVAGDFSALHKRAVYLLAMNTFGDFRDAHIFVGRQINDIIRQAGVEAIAEKISTGATVKQAKKVITNRLIDEGINGIVDKRGRSISLDAYAETVARSTTREATNKATLNQMTALGYDLVKMSEHYSPCPICAPLEGRIYSISGRSADYPPLTVAHSGPYANIHPRCVHVLTPYIPELSDDREGDLEKSNRPFDIDPRSKRELEAYNKSQTDKRKLRSDRNQFERYKLAMPDDVTTFSAFRRMKNADSEKWQGLVSQYKSIRQS